MNDEFLVTFGSEVKALSNGHFGGYLVRFSSDETPDLANEFFTKDTDFGIISGQKTPVYFNHRIPLKTENGGEVLVKQKIGEGSMTIDEAGILMDAIIWNRDNYEKAIIQAGKKSKLGWSSGTAPHLVDYEKVGKARFIKSWPLGLDASLTPIPCEPMNKAITLKALQSVKFMKGIFQETMESQTPSRWDMESTYYSVIRKIATAASVASAAGSDFDLEAMLKEATGEYASMMQEHALAQIKEWLDAGAQEEFYFKSVTGAEAMVDSLDALDIDTHTRLTVSAMKGLTSRFNGNYEARQKSGRALSQKIRQLIASVMKDGTAVLATLQSLADQAEPAPDNRKVRAEQTDYFMAKYRYDRR